MNVEAGGKSMWVWKDYTGYEYRQDKKNYDTS